MSRELMLPRIWNEHVVALELDDAEHDAWETLHDAIGDAQGVEAEWDSASHLALHRLLGYPDEESGALALVAAMVAGGVDVGDSYPQWLREYDSFAEQEKEWELLLQLRLDDRIGWSFGDQWDALTYWGESELMAAGNFARVLALPQ
jgi:hypothetical protein